MNPLDHSLQRLFKAAARAPQAVPGPLPFTLEAKALAQWRSTATEDEFAFLVGLFRRAVIFAGLIMALSFAWNYVENKNEAATSVLANYAIKMQLPP